MSRSQKKQQQERQNLLDSMKPGDSVVTIGGLHGVVSEIDNDKRTVVLDCEGSSLSTIVQQSKRSNQGLS